MKDLEARVRKLFEPLGLPFRDVVTPRQFLGIEKDAFAARLAYVVTWIGYLQWRYQDEGVLHPYLRDSSRPHPRQLPHPILQDDPSRILNDDAIMRYDAEGKPYEPAWPEADVIMGNPPFLGGKRMRTELQDQYVDDLFEVYEDRVPHEADLVSYWYEKARAQIEQGKARRAGLLATNSIRAGANREVLERIKATGDIFMAWADREWVLEGAAVRISIVGFDKGKESEKRLDGLHIVAINPDLTASVDTTRAESLSENLNISYMGDTKGGAFDIDSEFAQRLLRATNRSGRSNSDVIHPWVNGSDITGRARGKWLIDFGIDMTEEQAALYEEPFRHVYEQVKPERASNRRESYRERWWIHMEPRPAMRRALVPLRRYIATPRVAKHRIFVWLDRDVLPDTRLYVFIREDDYFFGVLHSYIHEVWSLATSSWHGVGNDPTYNNTTCFETFPFPWPPGHEDTSSPAYQAIAEAAKALHEERHAWLNPPDELIAGPAAARLLRERTLTTVYNAVEEYRRRGMMHHAPTGNDAPNGPRKARTAAQAFAPRLAALHDSLDRAVLAAYGWDDISPHPPAPSPLHGEGEQNGQLALRTAAGDEEVLRRLLALNLARGSRGRE
jgi:hypothetical protein